MGVDCASSTACKVTVGSVKRGLAYRAKTSFLPPTVGRLGLSRHKAMEVGRMLARVAWEMDGITVLVSPEGEIFVLTEAEAFVALKAYETWFVGSYTRGIAAKDVADDLRIRQNELRRSP